MQPNQNFNFEDLKAEAIKGLYSVKPLKGYSEIDKHLQNYSLSPSEISSITDKSNATNQNVFSNVVVKMADTRTDFKISSIG